MTDTESDPPPPPTHYFLIQSAQNNGPDADDYFIYARYCDPADPTVAMVVSVFETLRSRDVKVEPFHVHPESYTWHALNCCMSGESTSSWIDEVLGEYGLKNATQLDWSGWKKHDMEWPTPNVVYTVFPVDSF